MRPTCPVGQTHLCSLVDVRMEFSMLFFSFIVLSVESECISERKLACVKLDKGGGLGKFNLLGKTS